MRIISILAVLVSVAYAEPPVPSSLYGAPGNNGNINNFGGLPHNSYTVPSSQFEPPLPSPDTHSNTVHAFHSSSNSDDSHSSLYQYSTPSVSNSYVPPRNTYVPPSRNTYATPPPTKYGPPTDSYLPPVVTTPAPVYIPPRAPTTPRTVYVSPAAPRNTYGPPQQQQQPSRQYGAPAITGAVFPQDTYGPPKPADTYGPPSGGNGGNGGYNYGNGNGNNGDDQYSVSFP